MQDYLCELMNVYQSYHDFILTQHYVVRGSILKCRFGTKSALLDTMLDHGVYMHGIPVMTCKDCRSWNIHNFGSCMCPESLYENRLPMPAYRNSRGEVARKAPYNKFPHTCVPVIDVIGGWQQKESSLKIDDGENMEDALTDKAVLVCRYGGLIGIVEVKSALVEKEQSTNVSKKYVVIPKALRVRSTPTIENNENILRKLEAGNRVEVIGDFIKDETDSGVRSWAKIKYEEGTTAWVSADQILPDEPVVRTTFPEQVTMRINGEVYDQRFPLSKWFIAGNGSYAGNSVTMTDDEGVERYRIAIGPKVVNPNYADDSTLSDEDFLAYNGKADIEIEDGNKTKTLKCYIDDFKAHSYNLYPDGHASRDYDEVKVDCENGVVQTGIRYPKAQNPTELSLKNFDGSIVEFCSGSSCVAVIEKNEEIQDLRICKLKKITVYFKEEIMWS